MLKANPVRSECATMRPILELNPTFDYTATFLWATSGALLAMRRGYDIVGVVVVALVSALGGGLIRDAVFLDRQPVLIRQPTYLLLVAIAVVAVLVFGRLVQDSQLYTHIIEIVDALGVGVYALVGLTLALAAGLPVLGAILVGIVTAVGGSLLRDIFMHRELALLQPGVLLAPLALLACIVYLVVFERIVSNPQIAGVIAIGAAFGVRLLALRFGWSTRPLLSRTRETAPDNRVEA
jgi:uncharacterized membrane protein YeiH